MGGPTNKLTDLAIKNARQGKSPRRISDGGGLFLEIRQNGFRAMARTLIRQELGFDEEPIERQLGHAVKGPLGVADNRADFIQERKNMMQAWAD